MLFAYDSHLKISGLCSVDSHEIDLDGYQDDDVPDEVLNDVHLRQNGSNDHTGRDAANGKLFASVWFPFVLIKEFNCCMFILSLDIEGGDTAMEDAERKKMKLTYEEFQKVTRAIVMRLRQQEENAEEGNMRQIWQFYKMFINAGR
jgi:hypothetical protein